MGMRIWSGLCVATALLFTVGVLAQDPPRPQAPASSSTKSVTVSGCIQRVADAQSPAGTSGAAGAAGASRSANDVKFVLAKAALTPTPTAGATTPSTAVASEYRLDWDEAKLTPHVGHKVEITGMVEPPAAVTQAPAASAANSPKLKVESIKMVAATCS